MMTTTTQTRKDETMTANDVLFKLSTNRPTNAEFVGMMRHTGTDSVRTLIAKLKTLSEDVILAIWQLRFTR